MKESSKKIEDIQDVINPSNEKELDDYLETIVPFIGQIVIEFNSLESFLDEVIYTMVDIEDDKPGIIINDKKTFSQKVIFFERWGLLQNKQLNLDYNISEIANNLKQLGIKRNTVVHADWENPEEELLVPKKYKINRNGIKREYIQATIKDLETITEDFTSVFKQLADYIKIYINKRRPIDNQASEETRSTPQ